MCSNAIIFRIKIPKHLQVRFAWVLEDGLWLVMYFIDCHKLAQPTQPLPTIPNKSYRQKRCLDSCQLTVAHCLPTTSTILLLFPELHHIIPVTELSSH